MAYQYAITTAPADADFISYKDTKTNYVIVARDENGAPYVCANTGLLGWSIFLAGVSANRKSFWDADAGQFLTGTVEQLLRGTTLATIDAEA